MRKRRIFIGGAAVVAAVLVGSGVAFATWSASGSGTGSALAYTEQTVTVNAVALSSSAASLYPGGPAGNVYFTVTNPNPYSIKITNITWGTPTSGDPTACPNSVISVDASAPTSGLSITIPANGTSPTVEVNAVLDLSSAASDACQGNGFNVPITATGQQVP
ncbi:MAG: hypothetical protein ACLPQS_06330 [Acidimicrobiales bacterium]